MNGENLVLDKKEEKAIDLIKNALKEYDKPFIAWSGGKDSLAVMHLVHRVDENVPLLFSNTGVNHPSIYKLKKYYGKQGKTFISTKKYREYSFWDIKNKWGWPIGARSSASNKAVTNCCKHLKKKPMAKATEGYNLEFNGMTAYESWTRYCRIKGDGTYKFVKSRGKNGRQVALPIGFWHVEDVWDYLEKYDIKYPKIYDQEVEGFTKRGRTEFVKGIPLDRDAIRVGCWSCPLPMKYTDGVMKQLRTYYPKLWKTLMDKGLADEVAKIKLDGQGKLDFDGKGSYFDDDTREHWLDRAPCFFDNL